MKLAIVVPVVNEAVEIEAALAALEPLRARGAAVFVVDGGSADATVERAQSHADRVLQAPRGRSSQMNAGAEAALRDGAQALVFVHADTRLPHEADQLIAAALAHSPWGRFDVRISGRSQWLRWIALGMNTRSRLTGICTGDQAIFMCAEFYRQLRGFAALPLMEDVEFSRRARRVARPAAIATPALTSGRRWERHGVLRTVVLMWWFRLAFFAGTDPARLARRYRDAR